MLAEKLKGTYNREIADAMKVSVRWVQALWTRYRREDKITYPRPMGRPENGLPGRREHSTILSAQTEKRLGARRLGKMIESVTGIHIPHSNEKKVSVHVVPRFSHQIVNIH